MIRLTRPDKPQILQTKAVEWTQQLQNLKAANQTVPESLLSGYRHAEVKASLKLASNEKCIYCESKQLHVAHGDVEHIRPKSRYADLTFEWENLGFVCRICNEKKRDQFDEACPSINPFEEEPNEFLGSKGGLIHAKFGNDRGKVTVLMLALNRTDLLERRNERILELLNLLETISTANTTLRPFILQQARDFIGRDKEYTFVLETVYKQFLEEHGITE